MVMPRHCPSAATWFASGDILKVTIIESIEA
jgi:hypothetical protein